MGCLKKFSVQVILSLPSKICHFHHNHAHLLCQHNDVITTVIPLGHLCIQFALFLVEYLHLLRNLSLLLLGKLSHDSLEKKWKKMEKIKWKLENIHFQWTNQHSSFSQLKMSRKIQWKLDFC